MSRSLRCLIVDDEPPAIRLLKNYVEKVPFLDLISSTTKALEALQHIENENIDLVFLDIQMPDLSGIQLSKIIKDKVQIIFTTAYPQFAIEGYELNAVDYLLKPFEFDRFYQAVLKIKQKESSIHQNKSTEEYLFVKTDGKNNYEKVYINEILYIEGLKNYVAIHLLDKQIITYSTLKHIESTLPSTTFIKIHKSYIVSINHIIKTYSLHAYIVNKALPISDTYRKSFFEMINKKKL
ncbi:LytR/AlgR family response regulator transcription factor [Aquimarina algiphila]|uniref:Response regulator transcription factor n=1 Tax=Aquimarina algiphila TaxID=2047982 RepID=A0A554VRF9_9FLAO|nr:LytTR family DNA-binding domain-containing protein [Aquimarina algiphila]TSE11198.1 response regulator transcription factor [Aquimarina algiphila]